MQEDAGGAVKTLAAPSYLPLEVGGGRGQHRPYRHQYPSNHYNRTKRKRDSSSCSNGAVRSNSPGTSLPPWTDPIYPYSKGIIG